MKSYSKQIAHIFSTNIISVFSAIIVPLEKCLNRFIHSVPVVFHCGVSRQCMHYFYKAQKIRQH